jgi:predicted NUDIX family NTP pyrophosphohydrolase
MPKASAGILLFRRDPVEVLVVHPGGPFFAKKDEGHWSIPKGELEGDEDPQARALLELQEETGLALPADTPLTDLGEVRLKSGKRIRAWAAEGDFDVEQLVSNTFELEWPPRSGRRQAFPEVDRAVWATPDVARVLLNPAQAALVDRMLAACASA